jgi:hypothetical protein
MRVVRFRDLRLEALETRQLLDAGQAAELAALERAAGEETPMPAFSLVDVNPASSTYNQSVSPRDYLQRTTAWYFGHAT